MEKKLTIRAEKCKFTIALYSLHNMTRNQLVAELKARKIPVPKLKHEMPGRLAGYLQENKIPVTVTIG